MLFASIDIGTNAVRLLFSHVLTQNGESYVKKASLIRIPLRLGEDVFNHDRISEQKQQELIKTLMAFKLLIEVYQPLASRACATAAMREASNSAEIVERIRQETGIKVEVISGIQEAQLVATSDTIPHSKKYKYKMYIDVGGGSTEISVLQDQDIIASGSFKIGTIRYLNNKIEEGEWDEMKSWLKEFRNDFGKILLIGSGGNINKIKKVYGNTSKQMLYYHELKHAYKHLSKYSLEERIVKLGLRPDRADVIIPASRIFIQIMKWTKAESIGVPRIGLADGLIRDLYNSYSQKS
jgi:exopolyphosphatase / guanosine-5'-triphosphate,3'-diphosphate pyrophosphatase